MKRDFNSGFLGLASMLLLTGCMVAPTPTPYPTHTPYPTYTPQSALGLPLSRYEDAWLSLLYPTGWTEIEEKPGMFTIWEPSYCSSILIGWAEFEFEVGKTSEDRYRERREATYRAILKNEGSLPQFEILHEYRLGEAPVFEYQYWDEDFAAVINMKTTRYIDVESRHFILVSWSLADVCGADKWHQEMDSRRALFDTVMQSITFR